VLFGQGYRTPHGAVTDKHEAVAWWNDILTRENRRVGEKSVPMPFCPPQIQHELTRARTRASAVRGQRLTA
jgi:hypothetical protein